MLEDKCLKCNKNRLELREYDTDGESLDGELTLPETMDIPFEGTVTYCDECVEESNRLWREQEKNAYIYDDFGNMPNDPEFDG